MGGGYFLFSSKKSVLILLKESFTWNEISISYLGDLLNRVSYFF